MADLIRSGDLERFVVVVLVFGTIAFLFATGKPVDDRLFDVALLVLGYYFRMVIEKISSRSKDDYLPKERWEDYS